MRKVLNKSAFIEEAKPKVVEVGLSEGKFVMVSEISQETYEAITDAPENQTTDKDGKTYPHWFRTMTGLIIASVVTEDGAPMFNDEDKSIVAGFSREIRTKITDACMKANGFVEAEKKPSEPITDGSTTSELQPPLDTDTPTNSSEG